MSEVTGDPLRPDEEVEAISSALRELPEGLGDRVIAGLACAAALGERLITVHEGDSPVPNSHKIDKGEVKERYKATLISDVASRLGIQDPESHAARYEVRSRLTWVGFLASALTDYQRQGS